MLRHPAGPASDVERPRRRQSRESVLKPLPLSVPARPVPLGEKPRVVDPVVVLARASLVVRLHPSSVVPGHATLSSGLSVDDPGCALRPTAGARLPACLSEPSWSACCDGAGSASARSISSSNGHWNAHCWWSACESPDGHDSSGRPASQRRGPLPAWRRAPPDASVSRLRRASTCPQPPRGARTSAAESLPADCPVPARHR